MVLPGGVPRKLFFAPAAMLFLLVIVTGARAEPGFAGHWFGKGTPGDPDLLYIDSYNADGTFHSEFRKCRDGKAIFVQTKSGTWSFADGILRMVSDQIDGAPTQFEEIYRVESLTGTEFRMRLTEPDYLFVQKRLASFSFPDCFYGV